MSLFLKLLQETEIMSKEQVWSLQATDEFRHAAVTPEWRYYWMGYREGLHDKFRGTLDEVLIRDLRTDDPLAKSRAKGYMQGYLSAGA